MNKHLIFTLISLPFTLSFIIIESFNFINIQNEFHLFKKHKESVISNHDIKF
jgi:hypothetical protein